MTKETDKWISVAEYAKKYGLTRSKVYMDIYFKRIPVKRVRKEKIEKEEIRILEDVDGFSEIAKISKE